jgi:hypothetical protein
MAAPVPPRHNLRMDTTAPTDRPMRELLEHAARKGSLVKVSRCIRDVEPITCFVLGVGAEWTLLAWCEDHRPDGFSVVRTTDISRVRKIGGQKSLTVRVLSSRAQWPIASPQESAYLDDSRKLLASAARTHGLVVVNKEREATDVCWVGEPLRTGRRFLTLHKVSPSARWHRKPSRFRLETITQIGFGGHYEETLREFAGPRPSAGER